MRDIPAGLQARLSTGVTTLARCFIVTRADGLRQGFTDHDADIVIDTVTCRAGTGLDASEATQRLGLAVDGTEIVGALADASLNEADLAAGRYDAAAVEIWLVDWTSPDLRFVLMAGTLGEIRRDGAAFTAEFRSLADRLNQESGRLYTATCDADLGDTRCTVDLTNSALRGSATVGTVTGASSFVAAGLEAFAEGWFAGGKLNWTGGANTGLAVEVKTHRVDSTVALSLWQAMPEPIQAGDTFTVTAGCDKRFATCRDRFANTVHFRGFPHIPGNDFVIRYPVAGEPGNDGGRLVG